MRLAATERKEHSEAQPQPNSGTDRGKIMVGKIMILPLMILPKNHSRKFA
jgi:hypothetical protein